MGNGRELQREQNRMNNSILWDCVFYNCFLYNYRNKICFSLQKKFIAQIKVNVDNFKPN